MILTKGLSEITLEDIKALEHNKISESEILDYKSDLIDDERLVKHVSAFANTRGGEIVFGVEETGRGGYPKAIPGVNSADINKERIEQILLSNISPRLHVRIRAIDHEVSGKSILIIRVPDSALKPHMNLSNKKYYKRYEFEAAEMEEREISDAYRRRFATYEEVDEYVRKVLAEPAIEAKAIGHIVLVPTTIDTQLIDTSNSSSFQVAVSGEDSVA